MSIDSQITWHRVKTQYLILATSLKEIINFNLLPDKSAVLPLYYKAQKEKKKKPS